MNYMINCCNNRKDLFIRISIFVYIFIVYSHSFSQLINLMLINMKKYFVLRSTCYLTIHKSPQKYLFSCQSSGQTILFL